MKKTLLLLFIHLQFTSVLFAQSITSISGNVIDENTQEPLLYANVVVLGKHQGTVTNETGDFSLNTHTLSPTDTVSIQYIGYQTKQLLLSEFTSPLKIALQEDVINLSETFVYGNPPDPKDIIRKVVKNIEINYRQPGSLDQVFVRSRNINDINKLSTNLKKNSIDELDKQLIASAIEKVPRHITSYTDFLGEVYTLNDQKDSLKIKPIRTVSLKEEEIAELEQFGRIFENMFKNTEEQEYWKVKSGILSQKIDIEEENSDSLQDNRPGKDSTYLRYYASNMKYWLKFSQLQDTKEWEFLYDTRKYHYNLIGGSRVNGEDVYLIDFTPKNAGAYLGILYISTTTYALIRADYAYAEGKLGRDLHLFGVGYTEDGFKASIYFENQAGIYRLKYCSKKITNQVSFHRNVALIKKRKRWLMDKTLQEIKVNLGINLSTEESIEILIMDRKPLSPTEFSNFKQAKHLKITYIDQFTDKLWQGYSIIEPTKSMREYKKQESDWQQSGI